MTTESMTPADIANQMMARNNSTGVSFNELLKEVKNAKSQGVDIVMPSEPHIDSPQNLSMYNNVGAGVNNYYQEPYNVYNYTESDNDMIQRHKEFSHNYLIKQLQWAEYYNQESMRIKSGYYGAFDVNTKNAKLNELVQYVASNHLALLDQLRLYLSNLSTNEQIRYHEISIKEQCKFLAKRQEHLMSPELKQYLAHINAVTNQLESVKRELELAYNRGDMNYVNSVSPTYENLRANLYNSLNITNDFMNDCKLSNQSVIYRNNSLKNQTVNNNQQTYNPMYNPQPTQQTNVWNFNTNAPGETKVIDLGSGSIAPNGVDIGAVTGMNNFSQNNPGWNGQITYNNPTPTNYKPLENANPVLMDMIRPQSLNGCIDNTNNQFVHSDDATFKEFMRNNPTEYQYTPYVNNVGDQNYSVTNNYLMNNNLYKSRCSNRNLATYKNEGIRENRRMGFVPYNFGVAYENPDYIFQLMWTTPIPDPTPFTAIQEPPMWYLTPDALGYRDYVHANKSYLNALKNSKDSIKVRVVKKSVDEIEAENKIREERMLAELNKEPSELVVKVVTPEENRKREEARLAKEEFERLAKLKRPEKEEPDMSDPEYVEELIGLKYLPEMFRNWYANITPEDLENVITDGLFFLERYKQFGPKGVKDWIEQAMKNRVASLEEALINKRVRSRQDELLDKAEYIQNKLGEALGIEDLDFTDQDQMNQVKTLCENKLNDAFNRMNAISAGNYEEVDGKYKITGKIVTFDEDVEDAIIEDQTLYLDKPESEINYYDSDEDSDIESDGIIDYIRMKNNNGEVLINDGKKYVNGEYVGEATAEETKDYMSDLHLNAPFVDELSLNDALDALDIQKMRDDVAKLKERLQTNLNENAFNEMTLMEKLLYYQDSVEGTINRYMGSKKFEPGVHKFFTSKGIYVIDNSDFSIKDMVRTGYMSPDMTQKYVSSQNGKQYMSLAEYYYDEFILPTIKPENKSLYKDRSEIDDFSTFASDLALLEKRDEKELREWKSTNMFFAYSLPEKEIVQLMNLDAMRRKYKELTGMDACSSKPITYAEWAAKVSPYVAYIDRLGEYSEPAVKIYDVISIPQFTNISNGSDFISNQPNYMLDTRFTPVQAPDRFYTNYRYNDDMVYDRLNQRCNIVSQPKCHSTCLDGYVEMATKFPPIQYSGVKNSLFG